MSIPLISIQDKWILIRLASFLLLLHSAQHYFINSKSEDTDGDVNEDRKKKHHCVFVDCNCKQVYAFVM